MEEHRPPLEIERKFLLKILPDLKQVSYTYLTQGYISTGDPEVRLRQEDSRHLLTVKKGKGLQREEMEIELSDTQFKKLWPATDGKRIEKKRYRLPEAGHEVELDVYESDLASLRVAEVEFSSVEASDAFSPPDYFGKEVTEDARYKNKTLATEGLPL